MYARRVTSKVYHVLEPEEGATAKVATVPEWKTTQRPGSLVEQKLKPGWHATVKGEWFNWQ